MRQIRFKNRKNVDELIQPILNLELVTMYCCEENQIELPILPLKFEDNDTYFQNWFKLFLYETYN